MSADKSPSLSVSVLNMDFTRLGESIKAVEEAGADFLHLDIMDGHFVDNISFGPDIVKAVSSVTSVPIHTHLMIENPEKFIERFFESGSDTVTLHVETLNSGNSSILRMNRIGVSLNPDIPVSRLEPYLEFSESVLVMSVFAGFGGQEFIPESLDRISELYRIRETRNYGFRISVDGGINPVTATECVKAGADEVVAGSYISRAENPDEALKQIRTALRG